MILDKGEEVSIKMNLVKQKYLSKKNQFGYLKQYFLVL